MPAGSVSFDPYPIPYDRKAATFLVFRYDRAAAASDRFTFLPNLVCEGIHLREGAEPGSADFRYVFDPVLGVPSAPTRTEHAYPLDARGPYVVHHDEQLCVGRLREDGSLQLVFDGFAQVPQANLSPDSELVAFQALGTPVREWDTPIGGAVYRNADQHLPDDDVATDDDVRFNADLRPNATDEDEDSGPGDFPHPVFLDPLVCEARGIGRVWTLGMAVRYLLRKHNPDAAYVDYPPFVVGGVNVLDDALGAIRPAEGATAIDWADPSTYTLESIACPDYPATGTAWPEAIEDLIAPHGFGLAFRFAAQDGEPYWTLEIYRKDRPQRLKALLMQPPGAVLDPGRSNVSGVRLQRDVSQLANEWHADTALRRVEASFVLAPGFEIDPADAASPTPPAFVENKDPANFDPVAYRTYVFDEAGDGHWDFASGEWVDGLGTGLADVFGKGNYAVRRRPGVATLFTADDDGTPRKAELWLSTDYAGKRPGVWDGKGTWQKVTKGEWTLLKDRLGIRLTMTDPNDWNIGKDPGDGKPFPSGRVQVIRNQCGADPLDQPEFVFRLTTVIEADLDIGAVAPKRPSSPTKFAIARRDDSRDRFRHDTISARSHLNTTGKNVVARDDTDKAQAHAEARRRAHEAARFGGSVTIPRFTTAYRIGDRIRAIDGRGIDLRTNLGADQGESPEYPAVVGIDWALSEAGQSTTLVLSDRRVEGALASRTL